MDNIILLIIAILETIFSFLLIFLLLSDRLSKDEKELIVLASLGAPIVLPVVTILTWFALIYSYLI